MSISRGGIIILDFKYRVGDLVEVRVPELAQRQMMSYTTLLRNRMLDITEYNIVRLINRTDT